MEVGAGGVTLALLDDGTTCAVVLDGYEVLAARVRGLPVLVGFVVPLLVVATREAGTHAGADPVGMVPSL